MHKTTSQHRQQSRYWLIFSKEWWQWSLWSLAMLATWQKSTERVSPKHIGVKELAKTLTWRNQQICQMIRDLCLNFDDRTRNSSRGWWQWSCSVAYNTRKSPGKTYFFFGTTEKNIDVVRNLNYLYFSNGLCVYLIKLIYCLRNYFVFDLILVLI